ncbi:Phosphotransferase system, EIIC [Peptoniphilus sp. ING2-D1G]|nr:Phosphotransferase system, EIIC [Peptoniphilus sp. ING2-D1G]
MGAMAYGLFASLLVGTILNTIGTEFNIAFLSETVWPIAQKATGAAIAVSIAYALKAPDLVLFSSTLVGIAGNELGGPIGVFISTIFAVELGKIVSKETKIDIVITPTVTVLVGLIIATFVGPYIQSIMVSIGNLIMFSTEQQPFIMGILVSVIVGVALTLPISSAALCMMLSLSGLAGGAATVGCCCQMVGFAVISFRDNGIEGLVAQGLGTSMLQMPNIIKNTKIWIPPTLASAILGPVSTIIFKMENTPLGSGMGTSGLVGQVGTFNAMSPYMSNSKILMLILVIQIFLPALLSFIIYEIMRKKGLIKDGDMKLS